MGCERIDMARSIADRFYKDLQALETGSYDSYRQFVSQFWPTSEARAFALDCITLAEMSGRDLNNWRAWKVYFKSKSLKEWGKLTAQFTDDDCQLGFRSH
jgi:hypothetical protein